MPENEYDIESITITYSDRVVTHIEFWYDHYGHLFYKLNEHQFRAIEHPHKLRTFESGQGFKSMQEALQDAIKNIRKEINDNSED